MLVAALFTGAGAAAAIQQPSAVTGATAAAVPATRPPIVPSLPRLPAAYDAPATLTRVAEPAAPAGPPAFALLVEGEDQVPARALEAYQRAASVIDQADPSCHLAWPLLAAIGRVESDHGRSGGSELALDGTARPPILGPPLDGRQGTARVIDTDHGTMDGDAGVDRAVGPMQFIPSTWGAVAVDADSDGRRDPQDIDDAALAAAVFLCAGHEDLSTAPGQRAAVLRYNHSPSYVQVVLATMTRYAEASGTSTSPVLLADVTPVTTPADDLEAVVVAAEPAAADEPLDAGWGDVEDPAWSATPTTPMPSAPAPPTPAALPAPTPSVAPSDTPSDSPTSEASSSATPMPSNAPSEAPSPVENQDPTTPDLPTTAPSDATTQAPLEPPPDGPAELTPEEQTVVASCTPGSVNLTVEELLTCLAAGLQLPEDDPRVLWILEQLAPSSPEPSPVSSTP
jgi:hypothetical protein